MTLIDKIQKIEMQLSKKNGKFYLFALFLREDSIDKWDLIVSARWIQTNKNKALALIAEKIQEELSKQELIQLSRIVIIDDTDPSLEALNQSVHIEHGKAEIRDSNFFGLPIKHAYIITSQKSLQAA